MAHAPPVIRYVYSVTNDEMGLNAPVTEWTEPTSQKERLRTNGRWPGRVLFMLVARASLVGFTTLSCSNATPVTTGMGGSGTGGESAGGGIEGSPFSNTFAVSIDGAEGWVDGGNAAAVLSGTSFEALTMSFWVSCDETPASGAGLVSVGPPSGGGLQMYWSTETGAPTAALSVTSTATTARAAVADYTAWHHIVGVYDGASNTANVYVDGKLGDTINAGERRLPVEGTIYMGRFFDGEGLRLDGRLDEVLLFTYALPAADIAALSSAGRGADPSRAVPMATPVTHWRMGDDVDGVGTTMLDRVGGIEARLVGGASFASAD